MNKQIRVKTQFGTLCAEAGRDPEFPEIVIWLEDDENRELQLAVVGHAYKYRNDDDTWEMEDALAIRTWEQLGEDASSVFYITQDELNKPDAFWC